MMLPDQIDDIVSRLRSGDTTLIPTESIWGISCDAFNESAVQKISKLKQFEDKHQYILLVSTIEMLNSYIEMMHPRIETLLSLHKKPLTLIHTSKTIPPHLVSSDGTIGMRVTQHPLGAAIIEELGNPIISTRACLNGEDYPQTFEEISNKIRTGVDFIPAYPSTIMDKKYTELSVIAKYDKDGELVFMRT